MNNIPVAEKRPSLRPASAMSTASRLMNQYLNAVGLQADGSEVSGRQAAMIGSGNVSSIFTKAGLVADDLESQNDVQELALQKDGIIAGK